MVCGVAMLGCDPCPRGSLEPACLSSDVSDDDAPKCEVAYDADVGEGEGEGPETRCEFVVEDCADNNRYVITCDTNNACTCALENAAGNVTTTTFQMQASCTSFSVDDVDRFSAFAQSNCGFELDYAANSNGQ
jgi:hypothetical protein